MSHPLTPREKVARIIDPAAFLFTADELMKGDPSQFNALAKADQIFTALASSGDHAELARLAEGVLSGWSKSRVIGEAGANAVLALIAEVAALRARLETDRFARVEHNRQFEEMRIRATEAERKLAEAVGLLSEVADEFGCTIEQYHKNGPHWTSADGEMFDVGVILDREPIIERIRTFLSKEAERG